MTILLYWNHWEFWVLATLLVLNLRNSGCDHSDVLGRLDDIESLIDPGNHAEHMDGLGG